MTVFILPKNSFIEMSSRFSPFIQTPTSVARPILLDPLLAVQLSQQKKYVKCITMQLQFQNSLHVL